jgi:glycosyltransferase involved in cell wall biosynthesis
MNLKGVNVLVDGYNLELSKGTGIKTYGISLIKSLELLEANVNILLSGKYSTINPMLNELLFFDDESKILSKFNSSKGMLKAVSNIYFNAKELTFNKAVISNSQNFEYIDRCSGFFGLYGCFKVANFLHKRIGISTNINIPKKIDIWHATYPLPIKISRAKKITTVHDLIPLRFPHATKDNKKGFYTNIKDSIKDSSAIITVSETSKNDLLELFGVSQDKVYVTYQPLALDTSAVEERELIVNLNKYGLKSKDYILFVGAIEPKKNIGRLLDAYALIDTQMPLIIVGKKGWLWKGEIGKIERLFGRNQRKVKLLEYVTSNDLKYLYTGAYCFVFPSLYEGFGLPPLEAMAFGCPVITSNVSSLPEVCGEAALYVNPYDTSDIQKNIEKLINNPQLCKDLSSLGKKQAQTFSMDNYMRRLFKVYTSVL